MAGGGIGEAALASALLPAVAPTAGAGLTGLTALTASPAIMGATTAASLPAVAGAGSGLLSTLGTAGALGSLASQGAKTIMGQRQQQPTAPAFSGGRNAPQSPYQSQFPPVGQGNQSPALASLLTPNNPFLKALMGGR